MGHLPREVSRYFHYFMVHNNKQLISGEVTGPTKEAGGMEKSCKLTLIGSKKTVDKLKQLIGGASAASEATLSSCQSRFVKSSCDILLLSQQFLHALIAINPCEGRGW